MITYHGTSEDIKVIYPPEVDNIFYVAAKPEYAAYHSFGKNRYYAEEHPEYAGYVYLVELNENDSQIADFRKTLNQDIKDAITSHSEYDDFYIPEKMLDKCIKTNEYHLIGIAHSFLQFAFWWERGYRGENDIIPPLRSLLKYYDFDSNDYNELDKLMKWFITEYGVKALSFTNMKYIEKVKSLICLRLWQHGYRAYKDYEQISLKYNAQQHKSNIKSEIFGIFGWGIIKSISKNPLPKKFVIDYLTKTFVKSRKDAQKLIQKFKQSEANMEKIPHFRRDVRLQETITSRK